MGNENSSRWGNYRRRFTTQECLIWDVTEWAQSESLSPGGMTTGIWMWSAGAASARLSYFGAQGAIRYDADLRNLEDPTVRLRYRIPAINVSLDYEVRLELWPCNFGGWRFWFRCPKCGEGEPKRCTRLYLAPDNPYFGCRGCHRLAYRSSQESRHASQAAPTTPGEYAEVLRLLAQGQHDRKFFDRMDRVIRGLGR